MTCIYHQMTNTILKASRTFSKSSRIQVSLQRKQHRQVHSRKVISFSITIISNANPCQKDFNKYDISSAQKQGGLAAGPNPANGDFAAAGVGGAAMVTGIEAMEQQKGK